MAKGAVQRDQGPKTRSANPSNCFSSLSAYHPFAACFANQTPILTIPPNTGRFIGAYSSMKPLSTITPMTINPGETPRSEIEVEAGYIAMTGRACCVFTSRVENLSRQRFGFRAMLRHGPGVSTLHPQKILLVNESRELLSDRGTYRWNLAVLPFSQSPR
ncbi:hypothetical protein BD410DRAFT_139379 [Rickenella mellea]|uniref:Uncharacterized protein n=1 Tax=Rickenella mellea TaxID=50990 RepID=A0A4Y7PJ11_9AGAM|nr:hypothetical protein BD410DRAFT_139379 [Rickenella mellea]